MPNNIQTTHAVVETAPVAHSGERLMLIPWLCTAGLFGLDLFLYFAGRSWTPVHYESLSPLIALCCHGSRWRNIAATSGMLVWGVVAVLFFAFGLTWRLAAESWLFVIGAPLATMTWLTPPLAHGIRYRRLPLAPLAVAVSLLASDKLLSRDWLSSFYVPHFLRLNAGALASQSGNPVYAALSTQLQPGHGGVLVVFEALGVPRDRSVMQSLQRDFPEFSVMTVPFEGGSTLPAEVRYLCGMNGSITDYSPCLPRRVESQAMHGNTLSYFSRHVLYRDMGFANSAGRHELNGLPVCRFSYAAICDIALSDKLVEEVHHSSCTKFHYLLTIDSHFPYSKYANHTEGLFDDLRSLLERMRRIKQSYPHCPIIIAGDHPPPLSNRFESDQVLIISSEK